MNGNATEWTMDDFDDDVQVCDICGETISIGAEESCEKDGQYYTLCPDCYDELAC